MPLKTNILKINFRICKNDDLKQLRKEGRLPIIKKSNNNNNFLSLASPIASLPIAFLPLERCTKLE